MKYLGFYSSNAEGKRNSCLSAITMMDYVSEVCLACGQDVEIVSAAMISEEALPARRMTLENGVKVKFFSAKRVRGLLGKILYKIKYNFKLLSYLLFKTKRNEPVLVYHSLGYMKLVSLVRRIKKIHLILEVNEIYADVLGNERIRKAENKFFKRADAYLFATELLNGKINAAGKPHAVIAGTYRPEAERECVFNDEKIHLVYAGTLDPRKGALDAVGSGAYLSSDYHIHILGFGNESEVDLMKKTVEEISSKSECRVTYDGCLSGEEYIRFIQSCHIGFSTQSPDADFNATSFPSKIFSYMSNGLRVVSIRIPAIENSPVGKYMNFYNVQTPEAIAQAIKSVDFNDGYSGREIIGKMNEKAIQDLKTVIIKRQGDKR